MCVELSYLCMCIRSPKSIPHSDFGALFEFRLIVLLWGVFEKVEIQGICCSRRRKPKTRDVKYGTQ